ECLSEPLPEVVIRRVTLRDRKSDWAADVLTSQLPRSIGGSGTPRSDLRPLPIPPCHLPSGVDEITAEVQYSGPTGDDMRAVVFRLKLVRETSFWYVNDCG